MFGIRPINFNFRVLEPLLMAGKAIKRRNPTKNGGAIKNLLASHRLEGLIIRRPACRAPWGNPKNRLTYRYAGFAGRSSSRDERLLSRLA